MREIVFDTETTGLDPATGDRVIEIGAVELVNRFPTGRHFHRYINPDGQPVHPDAERVHGLSNARLVGEPLFRQIADEFLDFVGDGRLIAHNAGFDMNFINHELGRLERPPFPAARVIDSLRIARAKHPAQPNSLDALCSRYGIDNSHRTFHGALLDAQLLAEVYIELTGGRQAALLLDRAGEGAEETGTHTAMRRPEPLPPRLTAEEIAAHRAFITSLGSEALWWRYLPKDEDDEQTPPRQRSAG